MMMKEIALHILDILQNSIVAQAHRIAVEVEIRRRRDWMRVSVQDDGLGMDAGLLAQVVDPFTTSRSTRKVGLGIPMFQAGAQAAGGAFAIRSVPGEGTFVQAEYQLSHWDRPPLGDIAQTMYVTILSNPDIDFVFMYIVDDHQFLLDTTQIREALGEEIPLYAPEVAVWLKEYLSEGIGVLDGGI